jgi:hypothetical protein
MVYRDVLGLSSSVGGDGDNDAQRLVADERACPANAA